MKVICINDRGWVSDDLNLGDCDGPKYGDILSVIKETTLVYFFHEWPENEGWDKNQFVPLSTIDETEMERNFIEEKRKL